MRPRTYVDGITEAAWVGGLPTNQLTAEINHSPQDAVLLFLSLHVLEEIGAAIIQISTPADSLSGSTIELCTEVGSLQLHSALYRTWTLFSRVQIYKINLRI
jgi:hypothetical protein